MAYNYLGIGGNNGTANPNTFQATQPQMPTSNPGTQPNTQSTQLPYNANNPFNFVQPPGWSPLTGGPSQSNFGSTFNSPNQGTDGNFSGQGSGQLGGDAYSLNGLNNGGRNLNTGGNAITNAGLPGNRQTYNGLATASGIGGLGIPQQPGQFSTTINNNSTTAPGASTSASTGVNPNNNVHQSGAATTGPYTSAQIESARQLLSNPQGATPDQLKQAQAVYYGQGGAYQSSDSAKAALSSSPQVLNKASGPAYMTPDSINADGSPNFASYGSQAPMLSQDYALWQNNQQHGGNDNPINNWGWDPLKTDQLRNTFGYSWTPGSNQAPVQAAPGLALPGMTQYDPSNPPAGSNITPQTVGGQAIGTGGSPTMQQQNLLNSISQLYNSGYSALSNQQAAITKNPLGYTSYTGTNSTNAGNNPYSRLQLGGNNPFAGNTGGNLGLLLSYLNGNGKGGSNSNVNDLLRMFGIGQ